ncbi:MAG: hypothetical protein EB015_07385 [Methylocystaceae bacterium]|nr:hypothetical protein [Methylocystaceae bacterium]
MRIKTINDVVPYLDNFYYMEDFERTDKPPNRDKNGNEYQVFSAVMHKSLCKDPEKVLSKLMVSHIMSLIDKEKFFYRKEFDKDTSWMIEWRTRPAYEIPATFDQYAKVYARFSIYPKVKDEKDKD